MEEPGSHAETIVYRGETFRRYSATSYFMPSRQAYYQRGIEALHREVYKHEVGPIPDGWDIHHIDRDPASNGVANLVAMPVDEHHRLHNAEHGFSPQARAAQHAWHRSEDGRAFHRQNGRRIWENRAAVDVVCQQCGNTYSTKRVWSKRDLCSDRCRAVWNREHR